MPARNFLCFPQALQINDRILSRFGYYRFLPNPLQFVVHSYYTMLLSIVSVLKASFDIRGKGQFHLQALVLIFNIAH